MYGLREECRQYLSQGDGGVIVNVCSVGATHQTAGAAYCASKGAVLAATKNTAFMYMEEGIRCNALSPGGVVTDIPLVMPPSDEFGFSRTSKLLDFPGDNEGPPLELAELEQLLGWKPGTLGNLADNLTAFCRRILENAASV
jgi:NAD(P)-dependent dehydrogenase (short-subunit alcohol dehydrogenase family)